MSSFPNLTPPSLTPLSPLSLLRKKEEEGTGGPGLLGHREEGWGPEVLGLRVQIAGVKEKKK